MLNLIALDGPSGVGKSTTAKRVAAALKWDYMDTGAMYRAVTLAFQRADVSLNDRSGVERILASVGYEQRGTSYFLNGEDVSDAIRAPEVTKNVSAVSADPRVRTLLVELQRNLGQIGNWIVDGRDIGTVVFPQAICKIFLAASPEARAQRRFLELQAKGLSTSFEEVLADQARRDHLDSTRDLSPLRKANDAVLLDSSDLSLEEVVEKIVQIYRALPQVL
ncbi:MAG: (d)CMP kinase [Holophagales bacterium]|jgi:cytidylate kinase|nr:(d)CMP kinase [Holophagales bacterium]